MQDVADAGLDFGVTDGLFSDEGVVCSSRHPDLGEQVLGAG